MKKETSLKAFVGEDWSAVRVRAPCQSRVQLLPSSLQVVDLVRCSNCKQLVHADFVDIHWRQLCQFRAIHRQLRTSHRSIHFWDVDSTTKPSSDKESARSSENKAKKRKLSAAASSETVHRSTAVASHVSHWEPSEARAVVVASRSVASGGVAAVCATSALPSADTRPLTLTLKGVSHASFRPLLAELFKDCSRVYGGQTASAVRSFDEQCEAYCSRLTDERQRAQFAIDSQWFSRSQETGAGLRRQRLATLFGALRSDHPLDSSTPAVGSVASVRCDSVMPPQRDASELRQSVECFKNSCLKICECEMRWFFLAEFGNDIVDKLRSKSQLAEWPKAGEALSRMEFDINGLQKTIVSELQSGVSSVFRSMHLLSSDLPNAVRLAERCRELINELLTDLQQLSAMQPMAKRVFGFQPMCGLRLSKLLQQLSELIANASQSGQRLSKREATVFLRVVPVSQLLQCAANTPWFHCRSKSELQSYFESCKASYSRLLSTL